MRAAKVPPRVALDEPRRAELAEEIRAAVADATVALVGLGDWHSAFRFLERAAIVERALYITDVGRQAAT